MAGDRPLDALVHGFHPKNTRFGHWVFAHSIEDSSIQLEAWWSTNDQPVRWFSRSKTLVEVCRLPWVGPRGRAGRMRSMDFGRRISLKGWEVGYHSILHPSYNKLYNPFMCILSSKATGDLRDQWCLGSPIAKAVQEVTMAIHGPLPPRSQSVGSFAIALTLPRRRKGVDFYD